MKKPVVIHVDDGMFRISGGEFGDTDTADWSNSLGAPMDQGAFILTGIHTGKVTVQTQTTDGPVPADLEEWEEVVEISVYAAEGDLALSYFHDDGPPEPQLLSTQGPGWYRMRVHARGRATHRDATSDHPVEHYLLTAWPQEPASQAVLRTSERIQARLASHTEAAEPPTHRKEPPAGDRPITAERARLLRHLKER